MSDSLTQEIRLLQTIIRLLRTIIPHLGKPTLPPEGVTQDWLRMKGIASVRKKADSVISISIPGYQALTELADRLLDRFPCMERGAAYANITNELINFIGNFIGREPTTIDAKEAEALIAHLKKWFAGKTSSRRVFVPCVIT